MGLQKLLKNCLCKYIYDAFQHINYKRKYQEKYHSINISFMIFYGVSILWP